MSVELPCLNFQKILMDMKAKKVDMKQEKVDMKAKKMDMKKNFTSIFMSTYVHLCPFYNFIQMD